MPLPNEDELKGLGYTYLGSPYARITSEGQDTKGLDYTYLASPFVSSSPLSSRASLVGKGLLSATTKQSLNESFTGKGLVSATISGISSANAILDGKGIFSSSFVETLSGAFTGKGELDPFLSIIVNIESVMQGTGIFIVNLYIPVEFDLDFGTQIRISTYSDQDLGTKIEIPVEFDVDESIQITVREYTPLPVTVLADSSNPFQPTIISGGSVVVSNNSTSGNVPSNPTDLQSVGLYVSMNYSVLGLDSCSLNSFNLSIQNGGGSWSVEGRQPLSVSCFQQENIFGLTGGVIDYGLSAGGGRASYMVSGVLGDPRVNRPFHLVANGVDALRYVLTDQSFQPPQVSQWVTASQAANGVASKFGASVFWTAHDYPLSDFRFEEGQTVMGAINSLASRVGAVVRWNGHNGYEVTYPDIPRGSFAIPDCQFITNIQHSVHCDINSSYFFVQSSNSQNNYGKAQISSGSQPSLQLLTKLSKKLKLEDPPMYYDLPYDYDKVFIQILINNYQIDPARFITGNPNKYFELTEKSTLGINYVDTVSIGGVLQPRVRIDSRMFPEDGIIPEIDNGNFVLSLYHSRRPTGVPEANAHNLSPQDVYRFRQTGQGNVSCLFFGALPMPGMALQIPSVSFDTYSPSGDYHLTPPAFSSTPIIDSVSFSSPGNLSIGYSTWERLLFYEQRI